MKLYGMLLMLFAAVLACMSIKTGAYYWLPLNVFSFTVGYRIHVIS